VNPIASAGQALLTASNRFDAAASQLANPVTGLASDTGAQAAVDLTDARNQFGATASTLKVADRMFKSLLDILA